MLTSGHYLFLNGQMKAAKTAVVGDVVMLGDGSGTEVASVDRNVNARGLYNPITTSGDIVVDGLLASTYTTAVEPGISHAILTPWRAMYEWCGLDATFGVLESGPPHQVFEKLLPTGNAVSQ